MHQELSAFRSDFSSNVITPSYSMISIHFTASTKRCGH